MTRPGTLRSSLVALLELGMVLVSFLLLRLLRWTVVSLAKLDLVVSVEEW